MLVSCLFSWEQLVKMKEEQVEFWTTDGTRRLRILDYDSKTKTIYLICVQTGKISWPLSFQRLQKVHEKIQQGQLALLPNEIEKLVPTWGNYITALLNALGCRDHVSPSPKTR